MKGPLFPNPGLRQAPQTNQKSRTKPICANLCQSVLISVHLCLEIHLRQKLCDECDY